MVVMELYESRLLSEEQNTRLNLVVDSIASYLKSAVKCEQVYLLLTTTSQGKYMTNTLENMYIKLKPAKKFLIEQIIGNEETRRKKRKGSEDSKEAKETTMKSVIMIERPTTNSSESKRKKMGEEAGSLPPTKNNQLSKLEERMARLEQQLQQQPQHRDRDLLEDFFKEHAAKQLHQTKSEPS